MRKILSVILCGILLFSSATVAFADGSVPDAVITASNSVVRILAEYSGGYGTGSGFVIKSDRQETLIVTNYHVVEGNPHSISVWISDDETISATIVAYTDQKDMCILKLAYPVSLKALKSASDSAKQGDAVYAVGFPAAADILSDKEAHTSADSTITDGIVSAVREATVSQYGTPTKILQINAALNSGNSGGPLFNAKGEVTGINTYGISISQGIFGAIDVAELEMFLADKSISIKSNNGSNSFIIAVVIAIMILTIAIVTIIKRKRTRNKQIEEFVTLRTYMAEHPEGIGMYDAVSMLLPVALQLRDMHNNGRLHLQVSPDSILVGSSCVKILDATTSESQRYSSGFAAPEIYTGEHISIKSDIYSFCAILLYAATGHMPPNALTRGSAIWNNDDCGFEEERIDTVFLETLSIGMSLNTDSRFGSMQDIILKISPYNINAFFEAQVYEITKDTPKSTKTKKNSVKKNKKAILIPLVVLLPVVVYIGSYFSAFQLANTGNFDLAKGLLFIPQITEMHDAKLVAYVDAGKAMDDRRFNEAKDGFVCLAGYLNADELAKESDYRLAAQYADGNDFDNAIRIYVNLEKLGYKDSSEKLLDTKYRKSIYNFYEKNEYLASYNLMRDLEKKGYLKAEEAIESFKETLYKKGQELYHKGEFFKARGYFNCTSSYSDTDKYVTLIDARNKAYVTKETVKKICDIFYFEDAADVLLYNHNVATQFLVGVWKSSNAYYKLDFAEGGYCTYYNLPTVFYGNHYYYIQKGEYRLYQGYNKKDYQLQYKFELLTPDSMKVYCYKDKSTHILYRD